MSIRRGDEIYVAPSGVQKERIRPADLFVIDPDGRLLHGPSNTRLKMSECTPLFMNAYTLRGAGAVLHSHALEANLVTAIVEGPEFKIAYQEMIKGIKRGECAPIGRTRLTNRVLGRLEQ